MNFYVIKEQYHNAAFNNPVAAMQFKGTIKSKAKIKQFKSMDEILIYLDWKVNCTKLYTTETEQYSAVYENKNDANKNTISFNGPYQASIYLGWENNNILDEKYTLGKSKLFKHLLQYTIVSCKKLLKFNTADWVFLIVVFLYFLYAIFFIFKVEFEDNTFITLMLILGLVVFLVSIIIAILYDKKTGGLFFSKNDLLKQVSKGIYYEIEKYKITSNTLIALINETDEVNITHASILKYCFQIIIPLLVSLITFLLKNYLYNTVLVVSYSIPVLMILYGIYTVFKDFCYASKIYFRKDYKACSLLLKQELKNTLLKNF